MESPRFSNRLHESDAEMPTGTTHVRRPELVPDALTSGDPLPQ
jgi:hypothetical protein